MGDMTGNGKPMTDDDKAVAEVERLSAEYHANFLAFMAASERVQTDRISDVAVATFDADGFLTGLEIDPAALSDYTNTELEEILTRVLRETQKQHCAAVLELFEQHLGQPG
jgi:glutamine synthetase type III